MPPWFISFSHPALNRVSVGTGYPYCACCISISSPPKGLHCLSFVLVAGSFDSGSVASVFPVPFPEFVCCIDSGMRFLLGFLKNSVIVLHPVALLSHPWVLLIFQRKHLLLSIPQDHTEVGNRK